MQADKGKTVNKDYPYRIVRHPGCSEAVLAYLVMPLTISTIWLYIPIFLTIIEFIVWIILEEKILKEKLPGYIENKMETDPVCLVIRS